MPYKASSEAGTRGREPVEPLEKATLPHLQVGTVCHLAAAPQRVCEDVCAFGHSVRTHTCLLWGPLSPSAQGAPGLVRECSLLLGLTCPRSPVSKSCQTAGTASRSSPGGAEESGPPVRRVREEQWTIRTATHRYPECALDLSTVTLRGLEASPDFTQEDFLDPSDVPSGTLVQMLSSQIINFDPVVESGFISV